LDHNAFVAAAAHDMKNSVCVIAAYLEDALVQLAHEPGSAAARSTAQALYETQRVNGNLVQLMAVYKLQEGMYPFEPAPVSLSELAAECSERVRPLAGLKGLQLDCDVTCAPEEWFFDRDLISSVVVQSLFNSVRYARSRVTLSARAVNNGLELEVADDGQGFPQAMVDQGFLAQGGVNLKTGSTGLGLYFARLVAELHRRDGLAGTTRLANGGDLGGGRFIVCLP
jgi:signal transduction histidine kinase